MKDLTQAIAYYHKEGNKIIVQNMVGVYLGQKHEHTPQSFKAWRQDAEATGWQVIPLAGTSSVVL